MLQDFIHTLLDDVPDYKEFLTVDEMRASSQNLATEYPETEQYATVAELFDNRHVSRFYSVLSLGVFLRMIEIETETSGKQPLLEDAHKNIQDEFNRLAGDLEVTLNYSVIPIRKLVQVQLGSTLLALSQI
jgi:hypothetical protein